MTLPHVGYVPFQGIGEGRFHAVAAVGLLAGAADIDLRYPLFAEPQPQTTAGLNFSSLGSNGAASALVRFATVGLGSFMGVLL